MTVRRPLRSCRDEAGRSAAERRHDRTFERRCPACARHDRSARNLTILLTRPESQTDAVAAMALGAVGVFAEDAPTHLLFKCIRAVMNGEHWVGREAVSGLVKALRQIARNGSSSQPPCARLTPRELECVGEVTAAHSNKDIAREFALSEKTSSTTSRTSSTSSACRRDWSWLSTPSTIGCSTTFRCRRRHSVADCLLTVRSSRQRSDRSVVRWYSIAASTAPAAQYFRAIPLER